MCIHCSFKMSTGNRHFMEYCNPNLLTDEVPEEPRAPQALRSYFEDARKEIAEMWEPVKTEFEGLKVEKLPMGILGGLCKAKKSLEPTLKIAGELFPLPQNGKKEALRLISLYGKNKISLLEVAAVRNPWRMEVPYFRQIYLCSGYFLFANNLATWKWGAYRISGNSNELSYAIRKICKTGMRRNAKWRKSSAGFAAESKYTISDERDFLRLLSEHGVMKIDDGFLFVVSPPSENRTLFDQGEAFSFTDSIEMASKAAKKVLDSRRQRRERGR